MPKKAKSILRPNEYLCHFHTIEYCQYYIREWNKTISWWLHAALHCKRIGEPFPYANNLKNAILRRNEFKRLLAARKAKQI